MNIQPNLRMDKTAFLAWIEAKEERCELAGGRVVMMPPSTRALALIKANLAVTALRSRLERSQWEVIMTFGLDAGPDTFRYPDVVVDRLARGEQQGLCGHSARSPCRSAVP
jgi:Putative restriction endonuclease